MKKIWTLMFCTLVLVCALLVTVSAAPARVVDGADLLTTAEEAALTAKLDTISETYQCDVVVATTDSTDGMDVETYTANFYDENGYGFGEYHDGVVLMISMEYRDWWIIGTGLGSEAVDATTIEWIGDAMVDDLSEGDYAAAFDTFANECEYYINGTINGFPFAFGMNLGIAVVVGFVVALIVTGIMRGQLKSVRQQAAAAEYVKAGSMHVTESRDYFLYRNVTRSAKSTSSSSGGSGGGRSSGGGKF
ncbi:MAG: TPM domain-containing protein [Clostridia bacterium]|nr:TPM domain-containing protein [Clostridia bacterium]